MPEAYVRRHRSRSYVMTYHTHRGMTDWFRLDLFGARPASAVDSIDAARLAQEVSAFTMLECEQCLSLTHSLALITIHSLVPSQKQ